jgi:hypothetical protein
VRMEFLQREMPEDETNVITEPREQELYGSSRLPAFRAFEIAVFHHRHRRVMQPEYVVFAADGLYQLKCSGAHRETCGSTGLSNEWSFCDAHGARDYILVSIDTMVQ